MDGKSYLDWSQEHFMVWVKWATKMEKEKKKTHF